MRVSGPHDYSYNPTPWHDGVPSWAPRCGREVILRSGQLRKRDIPHHLFIYLLLVNLVFPRADTRSPLKWEVRREREVVLFRQGTCQGRRYLPFAPGA